MNKIAVFSDIHANLEALQVILDDIRHSSFDEVICLGDVLAMGPNPKECLDLILHNNIRMILGNHERYYLYGYENKHWMKEDDKKHPDWIASQLNAYDRQSLLQKPLSICLHSHGKTISFMHFPFNTAINDFYNTETFNDEQTLSIFEQYGYDYIFFGHEHDIEKILMNHKNYINVGSSSYKNNGVTHYTIIDVDEQKLTVTKRSLEYDYNKLVDKINNTNYPKIKTKRFFGIND